jgi:hypothetical protein
VGRGRQKELCDDVCYLSFVISIDCLTMGNDTRKICRDNPEMRL